MFSTPEPILRALVGPLPKNDRGHELDLGTRAFLRTVAGARASKKDLGAMRLHRPSWDRTLPMTNPPPWKYTQIGSGVPSGGWGS